MTINYLKNSQIDKTRWDQVIEASTNGRVYACSWYLDRMAEQWDALVVGDYEMIMPLPWNRKYGIYYIYMPFYVQQLDIYSMQHISPEMYSTFVEAIPFKFRWIDLCLGISEKLILKEGIQTKLRTNYVLDLDRPYSEIYNGYRSDAKKKLQKNITFTYEDRAEIQKVIHDYKLSVGKKLPDIKEQHFVRLGKALVEAQKRNYLLSAQIRDHHGVISATGLFLVYKKRAHYILGSQTSKGRETHASHYLLDHFFMTYCRHIQVFDFEGSDNPGIADFFKKWGAQIENYAQISRILFPFNLWALR